MPNTDTLDWGYSKELLRNIIKADPGWDLTLGLIETRLEGSYFTRCPSPNVYVTTFYQAADILQDAEIDLFHYLLKTIYANITRFHMRADDINYKYPSHHETRGCIFDMTGNKGDLVYACTDMRLCEEYEAALPKYAPILTVLPLAREADKAYEGYFSVDKKGKLKDTRGDTADDQDTYALIMRDKERLLSFETPLRFIFSHSALKEGWDNPTCFRSARCWSSPARCRRGRRSGAACGFASTSRASGYTTARPTCCTSSPASISPSLPTTCSGRSSGRPASGSARWTSPASSTSRFQ